MIRMVERDGVTGLQIAFFCPWDRHQWVKDSWRLYDWLLRLWKDRMIDAVDAWAAEHKVSIHEGYSGGSTTVRKDKDHDSVGMSAGWLMRVVTAADKTIPGGWRKMAGSGKMCASLGSWGTGGVRERMRRRRLRRRRRKTGRAWTLTRICELVPAINYLNTPSVVDTACLFVPINHQWHKPTPGIERQLALRQHVMAAACASPRQSIQASPSQVKIPKSLPAFTTCQQHAMMLSLPQYLEQRDAEYRILYDIWLHGSDECRDAPETWPADRCMLTRLPAELMLLVCEGLYQADLFHLALTCRALAHVAVDLLYRRDVADFDCLALRWACTLGTVGTLERSFRYGARASHVFDPQSHARCSWVVGSTSNDVAFGSTPLRTAILASEPEIVRLLLAHGASANAPDPMGANCDHPSSPLLSHQTLYPINLAMGTPDMLFFDTFEPGHLGILRHLLNAGADPNQYPAGTTQRLYRSATVSGFTPLLMAMQASVPAQTVELLLTHGADPTRIGTYQGIFFSSHQRASDQFWNCSPLGAVLFCSGASDTFPLDLEKIRLLLEYGAVHELAYIGRSSICHPMPVLCRHWNHCQAADVLKLFIANGADMTAWAERAVPPVFPLIWSTEAFISRCRRTPGFTKASAAICQAATTRASAAIRKVCDVITLMAEATLVDDGCDGPVRKSTLIDAVVSPSAMCLSGARNNQTALRYLCRPTMFKGATAVISVLLRYGADMNSADSQGRTALHQASMLSSGDRVAALVKFLGGPAASGLVVDALDARGWTPLHCACLFGYWGKPDGQVATARLLLESGASPRARTWNGWTPLSLAALCANKGLVSLLLDHGANMCDLILPYGPERAPAIAPMGRVVFLDWNPIGRPGSLLPHLATELTERRESVAALLEARLGIPIPRQPALDWTALPTPVEQTCVYEYDYDAVLAGIIPRCGVDIVDPPFCMPRVQYNDLAGQDIEQDLDEVLPQLDDLGLEAWVVPVQSLRWPNVFWRGSGDGRDTPRAA